MHCSKSNVPHVDLSVLASIASTMLFMFCSRYHFVYTGGLQKAANDIIRTYTRNFSILPRHLPLAYQPDSKSPVKNFDNGWTMRNIRMRLDPDIVIIEGMRINISLHPPCEWQQSFFPEMSEKPRRKTAIVVGKRFVH